MRRPAPAGDVLVVVPARNEAESLPGLVAEIAEAWPRAELLVVDDASDDGSADLLAGLGVSWLRLPDRLGVGGAMRAGLRWATRRGHRVVLRLDGDGQHDPLAARALVDRLEPGDVDAVVGSRYLAERRGFRSAGWRRLGQPLLGRLLSRVTGSPVTDPTSGCWAFGPRAIGVLADHHPTGYPEPELHLFLARNRLAVTEVPLAMRPRRSGRTTLTASRAVVAIARVILALTVVPLRAPVARDPVARDPVEVPLP